MCQKKRVKGQKRTNCRSRLHSNRPVDLVFPSKVSKSLYSSHLIGCCKGGCSIYKKTEVKIEVKDLMEEFRKHGLIYVTKNKPMARQSLREVSQFVD
jgi:hypothetical protein